MKLRETTAMLWAKLSLCTVLIIAALGLVVPLALAQITATVDFVPSTLNLSSKGKWVKCFIELPEEYDVNDIDAKSILLDGVIAPQKSKVAEEEGVLKVSFNKPEVIAYLSSLELPQMPAQVTLTITGSLNSGETFEGSDTIRVINKGKKK